MPDVLALLSRSAIPEIAHGYVIAVVIAANILTVPAPLWRVTGIFSTYVHELGHAYTGVLLGRRVRSVRVRADHSGLAVSSGSAFSAVISGICGYPAPAIVGALTLWAVSSGFTGLALVAGTLLTALSLVIIRGWLSVAVLVLSVAVGIALILWASPELRSYVLLTLGIALLIAGIRDLIKLMSVHVSRRHALGSSDAYLLRQRTGVPSIVWILVMAALVAGSLWLGGLSVLRLW